MSKRNNGFGVLSTAIQEEDEFFSDLAERTKISPKPKRVE
jgi:hypothetical protein